MNLLNKSQILLLFSPPDLLFKVNNNVGRILGRLPLELTVSGNLTLTRSCQGLCHSAHSVLWFEMSSRVSTSAHLPSFRVPSSTESVEQIQCLPDSEQGIWSRACSVTQFIQADAPFVAHFYHVDIINSQVEMEGGFIEGRISEVSVAGQQACSC